MRPCPIDNKEIFIAIVIPVYLPSCFGQEIVERPFGLRVKLSPVHLFTKRGGGFTLSFVLMNVKRVSCKYHFL